MQAERHVVDGQLDDALRVRREVGPDRRVVRSEPARLDPEQRVRGIDPLPVRQAVARLVGLSGGAQQHHFHGTGAHRVRLRLDGPGEAGEGFTAGPAAPRACREVEQGRRAVRAVLLGQFPVDGGRPRPAERLLREGEIVCRLAVVC